MFDIGISELGVIAVVALIVIGPERLPRVARLIGTMLGRAQRYVNDVKAEVNREIELEELKKLQTEMQDAARGIQQSVSSAGAEMQSAVHDMERGLQSGVDEVRKDVSTATPAIGAVAPAADSDSLSPASSDTGTVRAEPSTAGPAGSYAGGTESSVSAGSPWPVAPNEPSPAGPAGGIVASAPIAHFAPAPPPPPAPPAPPPPPAPPEPPFQYTELQEPPMEAAPADDVPGTTTKPDAPAQSTLFP